MRTTIDVDEQLVKRAMELTGAQTSSEVIHFALLELVSSRKTKNLLDLAGRVRFRKRFDQKAMRKLRESFLWRVRVTIFSMANTTRDLLEQALELPLDERARMAADLLESLSEPEEGVEEAWANEIRSRVAAARAGELESTDWRIVLDRVEKDVLGR